MIRPWSDIRLYYADLAQRGPWLRWMEELVTQVEASPTMSRLFAWTSMHDLHILQTRATYPYDGPQLVISPRDDGAVEYRYVDTPIASKQWRRIVPGSEAFARLQRFADDLRWFAHSGKSW